MGRTIRGPVLATAAAGLILAALLAGTTIDHTIRDLVTSLAPTLLNEIADLFAAGWDRLTP